MNNNKDREPELPELPEWDPEWSMLSAEEIGEKLKSESDSLTDFMSALDELNTDDVRPGSAISDKASDVLLPYFLQALKALNEEEKRFRNGEAVLNFAKYKQYYDAYHFFSGLKERGVAVNVEVDFERRKKAVWLTAYFNRSFELTGNDKDEFAKVLTSAYCMNVATYIDGRIALAFSYPKMWLEIKGDIKA